MAVVSCGYAVLVMVMMAVCYQQCVAKPPPWAMSHSYHGSNGKHEGDILLDDRTRSMLQNPNELNPQTRNIIKGSSYHWPNGVVPYVFDSKFDNYPHERTIILGAIGQVHQVSCVRFVKRTREQYYIKFTRGQGCSSYVGRLQMAEQPVVIGDTCAVTGTVIHELLHVLGFFHTSSRPDRDSYVIIKNANIIPGFEHNFWKYQADQVDEFDGPYEVTSIMHPPKNAWSKNVNSLNTIESKKGNDVFLGNSAMTEVDIGQLNTLYQCSTNQYPVCFQSLGMQDGRISNSMLSASSYKSYHDPHQARLHLASTSIGDGAWCPSTSQAGQYLQIDLGGYKYIKGIATQGFYSIFGFNSWVRNYNFHFSYDGSYWYDYATWNPNGLTANYDGTSVQYNKLPVLISARFLRIIPTSWNVEMCLRLEIYGCNYY